MDSCILGIMDMQSNPDLATMKVCEKKFPIKHYLD
jgi:hypothetical protein